MFNFVNAIDDNFDVWHGGALDHTENDINGYMFLVNLGNNRQEIFSMALNNLCIGSHYVFSAYMANIVRQSRSLQKPNVIFEVRTLNAQNQMLAQSSTGRISDYENLTWTKYGLSFNTSSSSVVLLMISDVGEYMGNDLVIDDIELRACSTGHPGVCPPGW